ncbi:MAG: efflux RND transporter periplasmic adaptor subunit [Methylobacteriaceae bacterium]|nr:efflux RND transporter periplasmic adaptor subunit [Methylobacteriaceae bacterium]
MRVALVGMTLGAILCASPVPAQTASPPPPAVGVVKAARQPVTESTEFVGRVQAISRVDLVARVTAFVEAVNFTEGAEVKKGDILYQLERGPFEADVAAKRAAVDQMQAQLQNAEATLKRAQTLLSGPAGQQSNVDSALANERSLVAQLQAAKATLAQSEINLGYTKITAPIDGKIGRTSVTPGNVVTPQSGVLATIVGQDPMYVAFPVSVRTVIELRQHYVSAGVFHSVKLRIRLPDGRIYGETGELSFMDNTVSTATDTIMLRGTVANPPLLSDGNGKSLRELTDSEFIAVLLEGAEPVEVLGIPRAAVLSDQQGDYVYALDDGNKVKRQPVKLGKSTPTTAIVLSGLEDGQTVVVEGIQRVRPGMLVAPAPAAQGPTQAANSSAK